MESSPSRPLYHRKLYRKRLFAVTLLLSILLAGSWLTAQILPPQFGRKQERDNGPRALGLIQLSPKGKGRLIPVAIMMDGKFFDAGSYKAAPVPMALDFGTVYEGFRSGVSQGVFTITQPGQLNHVWIAEGTWLPAGSKALEKHKKYSAPVIDDDKGGPPVLHRRVPKTDTDSKDTDKDKNNSNSKDSPKPATPSASRPAAPPASAPSPPDAAKASAPASPEPSKAPASSASDDENITDPNRPRLRRGKPDSSAHREPFATFDQLTDAAPGTGSPGAAKPDAKTAKDSA